MDGRKSLLWACSLFLCAGCYTTNAQKLPQNTPAAPAAPPPLAAAPVEASVKKDTKRTPRFLVACAKLKENEAKTLSQYPEQQFKLRDDARQLYQEAVKLDATSIEAQRGLGRIYVELNDYERAQDIFKKAIAKLPKESIFWFELGQMHNRKKDFNAAVQCLNKALEMDPENRLYITTLGFTLARAGQTEQSLTLLTRSMGAASAHYNVARMLLHLQRTEEGVQHLRQAVQLNPNLSSARELLSELDNGGRANVTIEFQSVE